MMSFGPGFATENQPTAPPSPLTNYYAGISVTLMFLLGVILIVMRLRARGRKYRRVSPALFARKSVTTTVSVMKKPEEARRQSA